LVGIASPRKATKIQVHAHHKTHKFKNATERFWNPISWWLHGTSDVVRKIIIAVTHWGKSVRRKLPF